MWSFLVQHFDRHTKSLWDNQNIREYNSRIDQASKSIYWLEGQSRCDFRGTAGFEEVMLSLCFMIFWKISSGYIVVKACSAYEFSKCQTYPDALPRLEPSRPFDLKDVSHSTIVNGVLKQPQILAPCCSDDQIVLQRLKLVRHIVMRVLFAQSLSFV